MRINKIELYNFGPYEESMIFDTETSNDKNIILIGGKNGAGKTTLFTAMRVCLYGHIGMGYKTKNNRYYATIKKLINNNAKMLKPTISSVEMNFEIQGRRDLDLYSLKRVWTLDEGLNEEIVVFKNGNELYGEELNNFEKFLLSFLPPELFDLYFFDGEKITDFFLENGGNKRIKNTFLTLCGYDTFEIMKKNFKRYNHQSKGENKDLLNTYLEVQNELNVIKEKKETIENSINEIKEGILNCDSLLNDVETNFVKSGGLTLESNEDLLSKLKLEEKNRELLNASIKEWANNIVPFLMVKDQLINLKKRINEENEYNKYKGFIEVLNSELFLDYKENNDELFFTMQKIVEDLQKDENLILNLSFEQSATLIAKINDLLSFDKVEINNAKAEIKKSLKKSAKIRKKIDNSDLSIYKKYVSDQAELLEKKNFLLTEQIELEKELSDINEVFEKKEKEYEKIKTSLEDSLKDQSKANISMKSILMIENLETILYKRQLQTLQANFMEIINRLMRKVHFVDNILIDEDFNVRIYKRKPIKISKLIELMDSKIEEDIKFRLGSMAFADLKKITNSKTVEEIYDFLEDKQSGSLILPFEISIDSMSNGEKQIFIMALYYSMISLCNLEIPFVIDTPFARIDTEHRNNISRYFFRELDGQVFILSTNEEIDSDNFRIIKDKIAKTYILENTDNSKTKVYSNSYFEV